jgi:hypothetical protein
MVPFFFRFPFLSLGTRMYGVEDKATVTFNESHPFRKTTFPFPAAFQMLVVMIISFAIQRFVVSPLKMHAWIPRRTTSISLQHQCYSILNLVTPTLQLLASGHGQLLCVLPFDLVSAKESPRVVPCSLFLINFVVALRDQLLFIRHLHMLVQAFPVSFRVVCDIFGVDVVVYL